MPFDLAQLPYAHTLAHTHTHIHQQNVVMSRLKHCVGIKGSSAGWFMVYLTRFNTWAIHLSSLIFPLGYIKRKCDVWLDTALWVAAVSRTERDNLSFSSCRMDFQSIWHFAMPLFISLMFPFPPPWWFIDQICFYLQKVWYHLQFKGAI